jgi:hypothetical protein
MDGIDFNSYLETDKDDDDISGYNIYKNKTLKADNELENIISRIDEKIKEKEFDPKPENEAEFAKWLILQLFQVKKIRLGARKQNKWEKEKQGYIDATHELLKAFSNIPKGKFYEKQNELKENLNWAKVLFYNEFAICHSGLRDSSISLGYAERSIDLLKEIYPEIESLKNIDPQAIALFTFAIYNKGEAERLLGNKDLALKTFK